MILFGEDSLQTAIQNFAAHYHTERNHQGLTNRLISPETGHLRNTGAVLGRQRLGGTPNYYYRAAGVSRYDVEHAGKNLAELARCFPDSEIVGLDLSAEMLSKARKKLVGDLWAKSLLASTCVQRSRFRW